MSSIEIGDMGTVMEANLTIDDQYEKYGVVHLKMKIYCKTDTGFTQTFEVWNINSKQISDLGIMFQNLSIKLKKLETQHEEKNKALMDFKKKTEEVYK